MKLWQITFAQKKYTNAATCLIDNLEKQLFEIEKNPKRVLSIILDIYNKYTKYLNRVHKASDKRNKICIYALGLEQVFHISNEEKKWGVFFLKQQIIRV